MAAATGASTGGVTIGLGGVATGSTGVTGGAARGGMGAGGMGSSLTTGGTGFSCTGPGADGWVGNSRTGATTLTSVRARVAVRCSIPTPCPSSPPPTPSQPRSTWSPPTRRRSWRPSSRHRRWTVEARHHAAPATAAKNACWRACRGATSDRAWCNKYWVRSSGSAIQKAVLHRILECSACRRFKRSAKSRRARRKRDATVPGGIPLNLRHLWRR